MKKFTQKFFLAMFAIATLGLTSASAQVYQKGDNLLNVGIGLGGGFGTPIGASFEHGFTDKISGGVMATYSSQDIGGYKLKYIIAGVRASYHFDFGVEKLDPYLGAMLGYNKVSYDSGYTGSASGVAYSGHAGARYYFTEKIGGFAEVGYGVANLTIGAAFKF
ncbi:outer membrane beta-barrel protein [Pedobacter arcticus]|uniref:outer membrane beta-barrel protein n=1 Tax=Pedobacter arcticus TaxID=752140 RepID=UPI0002EB45D6|nr:outer membrane beta-barrel protein [Pedobacter arcticus]